MRHQSSIQKIQKKHIVVEQTSSPYRLACPEHPPPPKTLSKPISFPHKYIVLLTNDNITCSQRKLQNTTPQLPKKQPQDVVRPWGTAVTPWANLPPESSSADQTRAWMAPRAVLSQPANCGNTPRKTRSVARPCFRLAGASTKPMDQDATLRRLDWRYCHWMLPMPTGPPGSGTLGTLERCLVGFRCWNRCLRRWPRARGLAHTFAAQAEVPTTTVQVAHYLYQGSGTLHKSILYVLNKYNTKRRKEENRHQRRTTYSVGTPALADKETQAKETVILSSAQTSECWAAS